MILLLFCLNICVFNFERESSGIFTKNMTTAAKLLQSCLTLRDPWTAAYQAPLSMGFSRQEYWSGVPLPSPINGLHLYKY